MPSLLCRLSFISSTVGQGLIITYLAYKIHKEWGEVSGLYIHKPTIYIHAMSKFEAKRTGNGGELGLWLD
jgi:hypothetical protein